MNTYVTGQAVVSCCGITLPPLDITDAEDADEHHQLTVERVEDELFVTIHHPMTKDHYISFIAYLTGDKLQLVKLYPEGDAAARFPMQGAGVLCFYCNRHGLMKAPDFRTATQYLALDENEHLVGMTNLRHRLNDYLLTYGGHIGYSVRPSERQNGYATRMLQLTLEHAREKGIEKVLVCCDRYNVASAKTIRANGGVLEDERFDSADGTLTQRYWIKNP